MKKTMKKVVLGLVAVVVLGGAAMVIRDRKEETARGTQHSIDLARGTQHSELLARGTQH